MTEKFFDDGALALLVPGPLFEKLGMAAPAAPPSENPNFRISIDRCHRRIGLEVRRDPTDRDPAFAVDLAVTHLGQIELAWIAVNDPDSKRYDVDWPGPLPLRPGSPRRNLAEELRALEAGLSPNQVRSGMRLLKQSIEALERYAKWVGSEVVTVFPAAYHNAVEYEREGYLYRSGSELMERIGAGFACGGDLSARLDGSTPFRRAAFAGSVRGRSWAIHDGILGGEWYSFEMYRMVGTPTKHETAGGLSW